MQPGSNGTTGRGKGRNPIHGFQISRRLSISHPIWVIGVFTILLFTPHTRGAEDIKLITLDPGHFHAALFQRVMLPGVSPVVWVYAPLGPNLAAHVQRVSQFNLRPQNPTHWQLEIITDPNPLTRMLAERRGNVVVLSGNLLK